MALNNAVDVSLSGQTGTASFVGSQTPTFDSTIQINGAGILDNVGLPIITLDPQPSAVNYVSVRNSATAVAPSIGVDGSDVNIDFTLRSKGLGITYFFAGSNPTFSCVPSASTANYVQVVSASTGNPAVIAAVGTDTNVPLRINCQGSAGIQLEGSTDGSNAPTGYVGEIISSSIPLASKITLTNATPANITSITLTPGDWDVWGTVFIEYSTGQGNQFNCWISTVSATVPDFSLLSVFNVSPATGVLVNYGAPAVMQTFSISSNTTVYLSCQAAALAGVIEGCGAIYARRVR
jgi:hypothetical protein